MNDLVASLVWGSIQISIFAAIVTMVVIVARRWLAGVVAPLLASSMLAMIVITAISVLPLRGWLPAIVDLQSTANSENGLLADQAVAAVANFGSQTLPPASSTINSEDLSWAPALSELFLSLKSTPPPTAQTIPAKRSQGSYWGWLLGTVLLGAVFVGVSRLLLGLWGLVKLRAHSQAVSDPAVVQCVAEISKQIGLRNGWRKNVRVFESAELSTAATIGCWSPVILLPADWRSWSEAERSSTIAHELAHVNANDFLKNLVSQFAVALNYFNPLVHWLGSELRVAQELAADATASHSSGGRRNYLKTMAEMALKQDTTHLGWLAQPFLPTRKTFLRRIEMLKGERSLRGSGRYKLHYVFQAAVLLAAVACVGIRVPINTATAQSSEGEQSTTTNQADSGIAPPASNADAETTSDDIATERLAYVSDQANFFVAVDLENLKQFQWGKDLLLAGDMLLAGDFTTRLSTATSVTFQVFRWTDGGSSAGIVIRGADPYEAKGETQPTKFTHRGVECLDFGGTCTYRPDPSTVLFGSHSTALKLMLDAGVAGPQVSLWHREAEVQMAAPAFAAMSQLAMEGDLNELKWMLTPSFERVAENTKFATVGLSFDASGLKTNLTLNAKRGGAKSLHQQVLKAVEGTKDGWKKSFKPEVEMTLDERSRRATLMQTMMVYNYLLGDAKITLLDDKVHFAATKPVTEEMLEGLVSQLNGNANQARSSNNLKQLALAMSVYESEHNHFPAAANQAKASEFKHSWRIELLRYLGEEELYGRYRLHEAWDSPHNQKVTAKMPDIYRSPSQSADATSSGYHVVTGQGTLFDGVARGLNDVSDGLSNTLLVVEAKRDTHWAKPEDIPFVAGDMKRHLASFAGETMAFARADGSVSVAALESFSDQMLDWFILRADGHKVDIALPRRGPNSSKETTVAPAGKN